MESLMRSLIWSFVYFVRGLIWAASRSAPYGRIQPRPDLTPTQRVLQLEQWRRQKGYYAVWTFRRAQEQGLLEAYDQLVDQGRVVPHAEHPKYLEFQVLQLERERRSKGYKPGWLYYRCEERNLLLEYEELKREGKLE